MVFSDSLDEYEDDEESSGGMPLFSGLVSTMSGMASGGVPLSSELFSAVLPGVVCWIAFLVLGNCVIVLEG